MNLTLQFSKPENVTLLFLPVKVYTYVVRNMKNIHHRKTYTFFATIKI